MKVLISPGIKNLVEKPKKSEEILSKLWEEAKQAEEQKKQKSEAPPLESVTS